LKRQNWIQKQLKRPIYGKHKSAKASGEQTVKGLNEINSHWWRIWLFDYDVHHYLRKHGDVSIEENKSNYRNNYFFSKTISIDDW
jgi:hypothetical protein